MIGQVAKGVSHKVVMPIDYSDGGDAIVVANSINKISEFKGKKVGYNPLSPSDFLLSYAMKVNGLIEKDIAPVSMTPEAVPAAMASGQLPIGVTYEPSLAQVLPQGVYNIPLKAMPKAFVKSKDTTSYYASGEVIAGLLKAKGQIGKIPATEATMDAQFVNALAK